MSWLRFVVASSVITASGFAATHPPGPDAPQPHPPTNDGPPVPAVMMLDAVDVIPHVMDAAVAR